ncbi:hypothetical protein Taro_019691 [Colocasia esculenta]|uniref:Uncharacterized protein n=1 Tax=Colocasia esculenta TaxID=4460 RepID=A0A843UUF9_COLES|nr:hypothetical protein [Colocasia esculenta]
MVKRALALEATNDTIEKIRGRSGEGSSDRKRKFESGNAPKAQQTNKKAEKAPIGGKEHEISLSTHQLALKHNDFINHRKE